jgi:hypothetical protein
MDGSTIFTIAIVAVFLAFTVLPAIQNRLEERAERKSMERKGAVLRGAGITVHAVTAVDRREDAVPPESDDEDPLPRTFYDVEITIEPTAPRGRWSPLDLDLFDPEDMATDEDEPGAEMVLLYAVDVWIDDGWVPEEELEDGFGIEGAGRLVLLVGAHETVHRFGLAYFWEEIGEVEIGRG